MKYFAVMVVLFFLLTGCGNDDAPVKKMAAKESKAAGETDAGSPGKVNKTLEKLKGLEQDELEEKFLWHALQRSGSVNGNINVYLEAGLENVNCADENGVNALMRTLGASNPDTPGMKPRIDRLLEIGVDVNAQDDMGRTALHFLVFWDGEFLDTYQMLLDAGADPYLGPDTDADGSAAVHMKKFGRKGAMEIFGIDEDELPSQIVILSNKIQ